MFRHVNIVASGNGYKSVMLNIGAVNIPSITLEPENVGFPFLSTWTYRKWKFDITHHCDKSPKMLQVALAKSV